MAPSTVSLAACWSGYVDLANNSDALPSRRMSSPIARSTGSIHDRPRRPRCPAPPRSVRARPTQKADGDDKASDIAAALSTGRAYPTTVTVYACFNWKPPMAGFVLIPNTITIRAVVTEALQRQQ